MKRGVSTAATRALLLIAAGLAIGMIVTALTGIVVLASSGAMTTPPGAWAITVRVLPGVDWRLSVPGLARAATSPRLLPLLDGRGLSTRHGRLQFARDGKQLAIRCSPCRFDDPRLGSQPLILAELRVLLARRDEDTLTGTVASGDVRATFTARLTAQRIDVDWQLPATPLSALYGTASSIVPEAAKAQIDGTLRASGQLRLPDLRARTEFDIADVGVRGLGTEVLAQGPLHHVCIDAVGLPRPRMVEPGAGRWISARGSGALLAQAVLAAEDQRFEAHAGYDVQELAQVFSNIDADGVVRGASTITQQLARMLYTGHERSVARKLRELLYAVEMERTLGKSLILGLYLNLADWGPGICGARAAALAYFDKQPWQLTPLEAAWLAGSLRNPHRAFDDEFMTRRPDRQRANWVLMQMRELPREQRRAWAAGRLQFASSPQPAPAR